MNKINVDIVLMFFLHLAKIQAFVGALLLVYDVCMIKREYTRYNIYLRHTILPLVVLLLGSIENTDIKYFSLSLEIGVLALLVRDLFYLWMYRGENSRIPTYVLNIQSLLLSCLIIICSIVLKANNHNIKDLSNINLLNLSMNNTSVLIGIACFVYMINKKKQGIFYLIAEIQLLNLSIVSIIDYLGFKIMVGILFSILSVFLIYNTRSSVIKYIATVVKNNSLVITFILLIISILMKNLS